MPPARGGRWSDRRLRSSKDYRRVASRGCRLKSRHFVLMVAEQPGEGSVAPRSAGATRLGLTVSRRVGGAVVRNRVKRRLRQWFREDRVAREEALDLVIVARPGAAEIQYGQATDELDRLVMRLVEKRHGKRVGA